MAVLHLLRRTTYIFLATILLLGGSLIAVAVSAPPASAALAGALTITAPTSSTLSGSVGATYSQVLTATGGKTPYRWTTTKTGSQTGLPETIAVHQTGTTYALTGTPKVPGTYTFNIKVSDGNRPTPNTVTQAETLTINGPTITTPSTLPAGAVSTAYSQTLTATGGTTPYTWTTSKNFSQNGLPPGITLVNSGGTYTLSGTPTTTGTYTFSIRVADSGSPSASATQAERLKIDSQPLMITTPAILPAGSAGTAYSQTLTGTGGTTPYTWTTSKTGTQNGLPPGIKLQRSGTKPNYTDALSGTPRTGDVGTTYTFNINLYSGSGCGCLTVHQAETLIITSSPTGVTATTNTDSTATVAWNAVPGAARYNVLRSTTGAAGSYIFAKSTTALNWTNIGLTPSTTYWYQVVTVVGTGTATQVSSPSTAATVTTLATPPAPTGVTATAGTSDLQINVSWNAVMGATSYTVYSSTTNGGPYTVKSRQTGTTYTNNGLTPSTPYYYVVTATTPVGTSLNSAQATATTVAIPVAPTVTATTNSSTSIGVSWTAVPGATSYTVYSSTTNGGPYTVKSRQTGTTYTNNGLTPSTPYYYVVTATTPAGTSAQSAQATATTDS